MLKVRLLLTPRNMYQRDRLCRWKNQIHQWWPNKSQQDKLDKMLENRLLVRSNTFQRDIFGTFQMK